MSAALVIDCMGDSLTAGVKSPTYPRILKDLLVNDGFQDVQVNNRGKNGFTVGNYLRFLQSQANSPLMNKRKMDHILLLLGGNDTRSTKRTPLDQFEKQYIELLDLLENQAKKNGQKWTILLGNIPIYYGPIEIFWEGQFHIFDAADRIENELNPCVERIARERGLTLVDIYSALKEAGKDVFVDGIHPDEHGNEIIARTWYESLRPMLPESLREKQG